MNVKPRLFIGSSVESLPVADALQESLEHDADVTLWTQDVVKPSATTIQSLFDALAATDFGLFILWPDDIIKIRGAKFKAARDNVIFELGLFAGKLGLGRSFFLIPEDVRDLHLPSDLLGITPLQYKVSRTNIAAAIGPACAKVRRAMRSACIKARPSGHSAEVTVITDVNDGSRYAAEMIRKSSTVRTVGTARQEVLKEVAEAADYLRAAEERAVTDLTFTYLRITSASLVAAFRQHLSRLLQASKTSKTNRVQIAIDNGMEAAVSYTLFDADELLLVVDNTIIGSVRDNRLMISSRDPAIVKSFAEHFDHAWNRLRIKCTTKAQFERESSIKR